MRVEGFDFSFRGTMDGVGGSLAVGFVITTWLDYGAVDGEVCWCVVDELSEVEDSGDEVEKLDEERTWI